MALAASASITQFPPEKLPLPPCFNILQLFPCINSSWLVCSSVQSHSGSLGREPLESLAGLSPEGCHVQLMFSCLGLVPRRWRRPHCGCPSLLLGCSAIFKWLLPVWPFHGGLMLIHTKLLPAGKWHLSVCPRWLWALLSTCMPPWEDA